MTDSESLRQFRQEIAEQRRPLPRPPADAIYVKRAADIEWYTPKGTNPTNLGPVLGLPIATFEIFMQEMPPSGTSDMQQHHHEAVHCILAGTGYSEIGAERHDWAAGDFVCIPPMVWHRHYNASTTEPVRMLLVENSKLLEALGLNYRASAGLVTYAQMQGEGGS